MSVHGEKIATISGPHLWLYQCLHGSISEWFRMRWICDIALLLCFHQPDWDKLLELADQYQCRNCLIEAVGLACALYDLPVPKPVQPFLKHSRRVQKSIERSANSLFHMQHNFNFTAFAGRILFYAPASSLLKFILIRSLINPEDFKRVRLPDKFFFAYYLLRPFSFLIWGIILRKWRQPK